MPGGEKNKKLKRRSKKKKESTRKKEPTSLCEVEEKVGDYQPAERKTQRKKVGSELGRGVREF